MEGAEEEMIITVSDPAESVTETEWHVWVQMEAGDPRRMGGSFIIGAGATRDEAVASAVQDLEAALEELQGPPKAVDRCQP